MSAEQDHQAASEETERVEMLADLGAMVADVEAVRALRRDACRR